MSYYEKLIFYIQENILTQLKRDAYLFEIYKSNNSEINLNKFIGKLLIGYYKEFNQLSQNIYSAILSELSNEDTFYIEPTDRVSVARTIMNNTLFPLPEKKKGINLSKVNFKPTTTTIDIIDSIKESLEINESVSQKVNRMFISYCTKPLPERERIIFSDIYNRLLVCCKKQHPVSLRINGNIHKVIPYEIVTSQEEMFNYLLAQEIDDDGTPRAISMRLCRIENIIEISFPYQISGKVIHYFKRMKVLGPQYAINDETIYCIQMNQDGETQYHHIYTGRPKYDRREEKNDQILYYFSCSEFQLYNYLKRFEGGYKVIFPESFKTKMHKFHKNALMNLQE